MKTLAPTTHLTHEGSGSRDGGHPPSRVAGDAGRDSTQAASLPGRCRPQPRLSLPQQGTASRPPRPLGVTQQEARRGHCLPLSRFDRGWP